MNNLKIESLNKCFSLLREYLDEGPSNGKKGGAILALNHLQDITAGVSSEKGSLNSHWMTAPGCNSIPRVDGSPKITSG